MRVANVAHLTQATSGSRFPSLFLERTSESWPISLTCGDVLDESGCKCLREGSRV